jgi:hypothetical protein
VQHGLESIEPEIYLPLPIAPAPFLLVLSDLFESSIATSRRAVAPQSSGPAQSRAARPSRCRRLGQISFAPFFSRFDPAVNLCAARSRWCSRGARASGRAGRLPKGRTCNRCARRGAPGGGPPNSVRRIAFPKRMALSPPPLGHPHRYARRALPAKSSSCTARPSPGAKPTQSTHSGIVSVCIRRRSVQIADGIPPKNLNLGLTSVVTESAECSEQPISRPAFVDVHRVVGREEASARPKSLDDTEHSLDHDRILVPGGARIDVVQHCAKRNTTHNVLRVNEMKATPSKRCTVPAVRQTGS